jgi:hypothetical protein
VNNFKKIKFCQNRRNNDYSLFNQSVLLLARVRLRTRHWMVMTLSRAFNNKIVYRQQDTFYKRESNTNEDDSTFFFSYLSDHVYTYKKNCSYM